MSNLTIPEKYFLTELCYSFDLKLNNGLWDDFSVNWFYELVDECFVDLFGANIKNVDELKWQCAINLITHLDNQRFLVAWDHNTADYILHKIKTHLAVFPPKIGWVEPFLCLSDTGINFLNSCGQYLADTNEYKWYCTGFVEKFLDKFPVQMMFNDVATWLKNTEIRVNAQMLHYQNDYRHREIDWLNKYKIPYVVVESNVMNNYITKEGIIPFLHACLKENLMLVEFWGYSLDDSNSFKTAIPLINEQQYSDYVALFREENLEKLTINYLIDCFEHSFNQAIGDKCYYDYFYCNVIVRTNS